MVRSNTQRLEDMFTILRIHFEKKRTEKTMEKYLVCLEEKKEKRIYSPTSHSYCPLHDR